MLLPHNRDTAEVAELRSGLLAQNLCGSCLDVLVVRLVCVSLLGQFPLRLWVFLIFGLSRLREVLRRSDYCFVAEVSGALFPAATAQLKLAVAQLLLADAQLC